MDDVGPNGKPLDMCWEVLVRETQANPEFMRGKLNVALRAIRAAARSEGIVDADLPREIELRCENYRRLWPGITLSPTGLANNWFRVTAPMLQRSVTNKEQSAISALRSASHGTVQL